MKPKWSLQRAAKASKMPFCVSIAPRSPASTAASRAGGNVTGLTNLVPGLSQKYVELLREVLPSAARFSIVGRNLQPDIRREIEGAARTLGVAVSFAQVSGPNDFDAVLARVKKDGAAGIVVALDGVMFLHRRMFVEQVLKYNLPYWAREYVEDGGLMTYSASVEDMRRRVASRVDDTSLVRLDEAMRAVVEFTDHRGRALLIPAHHAAEAGHVDPEDGHELAAR